MAKGFFGIFSKKAEGEVPVKYEPDVEDIPENVRDLNNRDKNERYPEEIAKIKDLLQEILDEMGFVSVVKIVNFKDDEIEMEIKSEDTGRIIGKEGATLNALQLLMRNVLNKGHEKKYNLILDSNQYREKRINNLEIKANKAAKMALIENIEVPMGPMSASDRRIIHLTLENNRRIRTFSRGEKDNRQVIIAPNKNTNSVYSDRDY
ncbi:MAG: hypothetical protein DKM50_12265 [Candidatus Margulisiibacteriota bacterium]|nr:MAG: hypothetical protein A2X43_01060 [Candidatus Margulisbacteria bacterium GWD2_39_127]OGI02415.1 MAG: hypothetical protein A2X42_09710 [Candidatus Margulisbacteria bacterium GWF2_38_17]OGI08548.1 MAG: hypothetical protein A2X41_07495 [Candidatus Margulisbacteria bacterium GWE2_39_32]PZM78200.1 MAG: hypothetical protein DKM50_12265 [Candidatus Margulisiibacteriota bacterium]HAR63461.1 hypothetical protein [Candidatus Margulisiibacteriota bacterium]